MAPMRVGRFNHGPMGSSCFNADGEAHMTIRGDASPDCYSHLFSAVDSDIIYSTSGWSPSLGGKMGETTRPSLTSRKHFVRRKELEHAYIQTQPDITFVVGPGGYGKSVLAAQLAEVAAGSVLWVCLGGSSPSSADLPSAVAAAVLTERHSGRGSSVAQAVLAETGWDRLESAMSTVSTTLSLVVLDGFDALVSAHFVHKFLALCRRTIAPDIQIVVTARRVEESYEPRTFDVSTWTIERELLEFDFGRTKELAVHVLQREVRADEVRALAKSSSGQPALLMLLLRNIASSNEDLPAVLRHSPSDVRGYLESLIAGNTSAGVLAVLEVAAMLRHGSVRQLAEIAGVHVDAVCNAAELVPLLKLTTETNSVRKFEMHDLACEAFRGLHVKDRSRSRREVESVVHELGRRGDYGRLFEILVDFEEPDLVLEWLERLGLAMIEDARLGLLESVLDAVPAVVQAGSSRVLLTAALLQRSKGNMPEAFILASAARRAAELTADERAVADCLMVEIRLHWDVADYSNILPEMVRALARATARGDNDAKAMLCGYLASGYAQLGDVKTGRGFALRYRSLSRLPGVLPATRAQALQPVLFVLGLVSGDIALAARMLREAKAEAKYPQALSLQCDANLASLMMEMGRTATALKKITLVRQELQESGFSVLVDACSGTEGMARAALGEQAQAEEMMLQAVESAVCQDDRFSIEYNRLYRSAIRRASGLIDAALSDSEDALAALSEDGSPLPVMRCLASIEVAANLLALGDAERARFFVVQSRAEAANWTASYHLLRADMVLAEIERQQGDFADAVARISQHAEYILTESANWQIAMYIRAFPGLLGVFSKAVGLDALPSHMLRMILPDYARSALDACGGELSSADMERLAVRLLGKRAATAYVRERASGPKAQVRLFGGMEVVTPGGTITDKDWRKRKARLLFALLVLRRGQDMPREQLFEHFWPEMDEDRAKSNFYVTWSIMKRALCAGAKDNGPCPYVEHVGGVCRIVPAVVSSDYAEFEDSLATMRKADRAGDVDLALTAAERISQQYRGELLPGELYDDWLSPIRDRCRHDYGDAMLRASQLCFSAGDTEKALHLARAGLSQDPWREDLYQAALRYLIGSGQRSGAIETYVACKSKLAEDLGLDPSTETQRLYDQILAMEGPPSASAGA